MEGGLVLADTSVLIDFFRKSDKSNSYLVILLKRGYDFSISAITEYEIYSGATGQQKLYWQDFLSRIEVLPFDKAAVNTAVEINDALKLKRKQIDIADLFIAATAVSNNLPLATLNTKHFERVDSLSIIAK